MRVKREVMLLIKEGVRNQNNIYYDFKDKIYKYKGRGGKWVGRKGR